MFYQAWILTFLFIFFLFFLNVLCTTQAQSSELAGRNGKLLSFVSCLVNFLFLSTELIELKSECFYFFGLDFDPGVIYISVAVASCCLCERPRALLSTSSMSCLSQKKAFFNFKTLRIGKKKINSLIRTHSYACVEI